MIKMLGGNLFGKLLTMLFTAFFGVLSLGTGTGKTPPEVPEDFEPVLRFAVCSDVHLSGEANDVNAKEFREFFTQSYAYSKDSDSYKSLDAVMICGDFTNWGRESEYRMYQKIVSEELKGDTKHLVCMGNHEFIEERETEGINAFDNYKKYVYENVDTHEIINGYHFIGLSYSDKDENYSDEKIQWLKSELDKAVADTGDKPIFVYQHPHPTLTVYGSINWSEIKISLALKDYPQVINFSGHSHYNASDPRSIHQGKFTAMGTGGITGLEGNVNYIDGNAGSQMASSSYEIVEADAAGNVRIRVFDGYNDMFYPENDYYLPTGEKIYTWGNLRSFDTKPLFAEGEIKAEVNAEGEAVISFPDAKGYYDAASYNVTVKDSSGKTVFCSSVISEYVSAVDDGASVNIGKQEKGEYSVEIKGVSPYAKIGKAIKGTVEVKAEVE
ncbi:MAG: metallophosphoesterase [Ruminococcaceae bacterium]|nr:metallophosphoesterase [Oscillospiraceae bacterium]